MNSDSKIIPIRGRQKNSHPNSYLHNFSLSGFLQIICLEKSNCTLNISNMKTDDEGFLFIKDGVLIDAEFDDEEGTDAALSILAWEHVDIILSEPDLSKKRVIKEGINLLLFEAARIQDEEKRNPGKKKPKKIKKVVREEEIQEPQVIKKHKKHQGSDDLRRPAQVQPISLNLPRRKSKQNRSEGRPGEPTTISTQMRQEHRQAPVDIAPRPTQQKEYDVDKVKSILNTFTDIGGFIAVGIFSPEGEMIEEVCKPGYDLASIGAIANELLVKAQSSTEMMDLGRGNLVHINAPKAHIFVTCHNESSDFHNSEFGKAHIHMALVISDKGNQPMAKMKLSKALSGLAPHFR